MTTLFLYVVAASHDPDNVSCVVPYRIDADVIFFGPCKKRLRQLLRNLYLNTSDDSISDEQTYVVGMNGSNSRRVRKIVWAGRISRIMTFEVAFNSLKDPKFQEMRAHRSSPLHVKPLYDDGKFVGYEHISEEHRTNDAWILDLTHRRNDPRTKLRGRQLLLESYAERREAFRRDCCFLCENVFFAEGSGIPITEGILKVIKTATSEKKVRPDKYAIFGYRSDGTADGLTGSWLKITGGLARNMIRLIKDGKPVPQAVQNRRLKTCRH